MKTKSPIPPLSLTVKSEGVIIPGSSIEYHSDCMDLGAEYFKSTLGMSLRPTTLLTLMQVKF